MMDPTNPYTVGYYDTYDGPTQVGCCGGRRNNPNANPVVSTTGRGE